ncbi:DUF3352 domain-containing protein [Seonamhaeicola marinus]|uniref:DUF3352 domain-containing protein n=1 Tax=Seonamhaeicola marinus TaxID=1912246 RepID=A0A5D0HK77_9FLAO|nr:DUF3352 domain-containing protein [Seonamhaeicola marinus]TYA71793.1 DUF3352 domain-containing protein [Seonamhaeicola marinus]
MKKKPLLLLLTALLIFICYQVYNFYLDNNDNIQSIYLVPKDAVYVIETQEPIDNWESITKSKIWKHLQKNTYFRNLTEHLSAVDTIFNNQKGLLERIGNRELLISAHVFSPKKYDFFYVVDLQKLSKLNIIKNHLNTFVSSNYKVNKRKYHNHEIIEVYDFTERETLYISFIKNQLIASYTHILVEASIDQYLEPEIGRNLNYIEVKKEIGYSDMFRLYFQYDYLEDYLKVFSSKPNDIVSALNTSLNWSGFHFDLDENRIVANGVTNTNEQASAYLKALQNSGEGKRDIPEIAPNETAFYLSFSFDSFSKFYENFETILKEDPEQFKSYLDGTEKVENLLDIDLKEHFMSWIDDEIALLQLPSSVSNSKKNIALVLKTNDVEDAKDNLSFILKQIKKKSPVKFKEVNYKGYEINFMSIKGFFKILLGKLFNDIEKPYFSIIEDYVVFSNDPNTIKTIIDKYKAEETLEKFKPYTDFNSQFDKRSSIFAFVNTPTLYNAIYDYVDYKKKLDLKANKDYFICFPQIGFQFSPDGEFFDSKLIMNFEDPEAVKEVYTFKNLEQSLKENISAHAPVQPIISKTDIVNEDTIFNVSEIYPSDLSAKEYIKTYKNGTTKVSVQLKDGVKHGRYKEYHENGALKISGKYKDNKQKGTWRAYDKDEKLIFKKSF